MRYYPVFIDLKDKICLVVGGGNVGCRKVRGLLSAEPAQIEVVDPNTPGRELQALLDFPVVYFEQRLFNPEDIQGKTLVFAATGNRSVNAAVAMACSAAGVLCNSADAPSEGTFLVPAVVQQGSVTAALSTGGGSPALARRIRQELAAWLDSRYTALSELLLRLRPLVLAMQRETGQNTVLFRKLVESPLAETLRERDRCQSEALLRTLLPQELHPHITELLHELA